MAKIIKADDGIFVEALRVPFVYCDKYLVEGEDQICLLLDVEREKLDEILKRGLYNKKKVRRANMNDLKKFLGKDTPVVDITGKNSGRISRETHVTCNEFGKERVVAFRSMTSARLCWGLDEETFERILYKVPGWKSLCPKGLIRIDLINTTNKSDHPSVRLSRSREKLFHASINGDNGVITIEPKRTTIRFASREHIPIELLRIMEWESHDEKENRPNA